MSARPEPLPSHKNGNFGEYLPIAPGSSRKFMQAINPKTPEGQRRLQQARANAIPKSVFVKVILRHCKACFGVTPARADCGTTDCNLYRYNTGKKCRRSTKAALKRCIKTECRDCGGDQSTCGNCALLQVIETLKIP
jgi:hypothetical protein